MLNPKQDCIDGPRASLISAGDRMVSLTIGPAVGSMSVEG
jgi:hypothetical protein